MALHRLHSPDEAAAWLSARVRGQLQVDSRAVGEGDGFIAWPGAATDGRRFVQSALAQGAAACLVEADGSEAYDFADEPAVAAYEGLKAATGPIAAAWCGRPADAMTLLAVTGTNGKTSTAWWLAQALEGSAFGPCAVAGTLGIGVPPAVDYNGLTTPDPVTLHRALRDLVARGVKACAMEASSIGIAERRLDGLHFDVAVFTNFTQDHLDYHGDMAAYWAAKAELFRWPGLRAAVVNIDDVQGARLAGELLDTALVELWTCSAVGAPARLSAVEAGHGPQGLRFQVVEQGGAEAMVSTTLVGDYNVANLLGVIGTLRALGLPLGDAAAACGRLGSVPGRMDVVAAEAGLPLVVVDYAHTPDALQKALAALRPFAESRGGRLWCVFGCGGDRDPGKRPLMGAIAERGADRVVVTSDNPRSESPQAIVDQIVAGLAAPQAARVVGDRTAAIAEAIAQAAAQDVVLLAGKGHEDYQEVAGRRLPFSDRAQAQTALAARSRSA
ncbi:UDP-N-acetylmuramoylalanyl-D-glutamate--2,6-diaminopimelate ligase [Pseudacidovorax intermedius]|uniref:UDP-N-acetylmuramoyl-L-alanyl-D-glutamate--2,6-diaminopimelate ligase n=1 Tax=Pseudacidovorax intermedius TaxID=433924 RepID=A0A370FRG9_9BURK|nr:UDP-N-acetylmuramoyl-L-alanyl-D-glutamate--2,6-diaminopimelate ligase [Pseudacidovorax intermedius]RDI28348.1 UDP-N-acetylmuramoylalanyl-D-glutamate--2,6-diaminopimelate ligase [Pseudacidovorax intermedius]